MINKQIHTYIYIRTYIKEHMKGNVNAKNIKSKETYRHHNNKKHIYIYISVYIYMYPLYIHISKNIYKTVLGGPSCRSSSCRRLGRALFATWPCLLYSLLYLLYYL